MLVRRRSRWTARSPIPAGRLRQTGWPGGKTPVVRGEERKAGGQGLVAQQGDDGPGPQPRSLAGDPSAAVEGEVLDPLQEVTVDDAGPVLDEPAGRGEPGQVRAHAQDAVDELVISLDIRPA